MGTSDAVTIAERQKRMADAAAAFDAQTAQLQAQIAAAKIADAADIAVLAQQNAAAPPPVMIDAAAGSGDFLASSEADNAR
jgi:hypothetical protein